jgi:hypothetical protein
VGLKFGLPKNLLAANFVNRVLSAPFPSYELDVEFPAGARDLAIPPHPHTSSWRGAYLIKHRDSFSLHVSRWGPPPQSLLLKFVGCLACRPAAGETVSSLVTPDMSFL